MYTPLSAHPRWCDVEGSHIALFCWVEQVTEVTNPGTLPTRLHQRGQSIDQGIDSVHICFPDNVLLTRSPHVLRLLLDTPDEY
jgi:hypothetical protein